MGIDSLFQDIDQVETAYIVGQVKAIFFENPANFYKVLLVQVNGTNTEYKEKEIVMTGSFGQIQEEEIYRFTGRFVDHPRYGRQFEVTSYQQERPTSASGVVAYLSSEKFKGIGKRTAEKIVAAFGEDAIDHILADPSCLEEIDGLNAKKRQTIVETIRLNHGMEQVIVGLNRYGFGNQLSFAIYQMYKNEALEIITENPYQLVEDIEGIGFKKADAIAEQLGYAADSEKRIRAAVLHELITGCLSSGDTYIEAEKLLGATLRTLESSRPFEIDPQKIASEIIHLVEEGKINQEKTRIYDNSLYFAEWGIGNSIQRLLQRKKEIKYKEADIKKNIQLLEKKLGINYGKSQQEAIQAAIRAPLFILTGGPGTGKTTVINGIVSLFAELNGLSLDPTEYKESIFPVLLAAPTGRAAKRMNEATGLPASTIHRLLGLTGREKNVNISANELEGGLLIVDEMSMVDTWLANTLLKAIPTNMQVIFVGDKDQLPSVGPGQVLHDLLGVAEIPKRELTEIYRQGVGSSIISLAHQIKAGRLPADFTKNQADRSFFRCDAYHVENLIKQVILKAKAKGFTPQDIQVLAPMYRGSAGIDALNKMLQEVFNGDPDRSRKEVHWNDKVYRIGDKVLQLLNNPESNVFNGDMGEITGIILAKESEDKTDELVIAFDGGEVTYKRNEWNKITLSYCCSIHKSQGSEFKMVILPMVHQYQRMLQRNLLYTAVTRSKEILILLGEPQAFGDCVVNESVNRHTSLPERIISAERMPLDTRLKLEAFENTTGAEIFDQKKPSPENQAEIVQRNAEKQVEKNSVVSKEQVSRRESKELSLFQIEEPTVKYQADSQDKISMGNQPVLTLELIQLQQIDPLIGLQNISPYDFVEKNKRT